MLSQLDQYSPEMRAKVAAMLTELPPETLLLLVPGIRAADGPGRAALLAELKNRTNRP